MNAKERFLLWFLAALIGSQIVFLGWGMNWCAKNGGLQSCPEISKRYETTFNVAIATVLALLTGSVISSPRRSSLGDHDAWASQHQPPTQEMICEGQIEAQASGKQARSLGPQPSLPSVSSDQAFRKE